MLKELAVSGVTVGFPAVVTDFTSFNFLSLVSASLLQRLNSLSPSLSLALFLSLSLPLLPPLRGLAVANLVAYPPGTVNIFAHRSPTTEEK